MALPKYKTSRANTHSRRANWKASAVQTVTCPNCGSQAFPHMACPSCGTFRGRVYREAIRSEHTKQVLLIETLPSTGGRVFLFLAYCGCEGWVLLARRPAFAQHCARESNSERELAQVESPVDFPRKLSRAAISREDSATLLYLIWTQRLHS